MRYNISIIIVNYNGKRYIDNLFKSLLNLKTTYFTYEVVFVDNNSSDDSVLYLSQNYSEFPNLKILSPDQNLGFAAGNNYGVKYAEGDYVVFLNNDTAVSPDWLEELYQGILVNPNIGIVASKLVFFYDFLKINIRTQDKLKLSNEIILNGVKQPVDVKFTENLLYEEDGLTCFGHTSFYIPLIYGVTDYTIKFQVLQEYNSTDFIVINELPYSIQDEINLNSEFIKEKKITLVQNAGSGVDGNFNGYDVGFCKEDTGQFSEIREIDSCCGAAMMMKRDLFNEVGGFDENFFMYYEDTDLSYRVKKKGYSLYFSPTALVRHIHTGSSQEWSPFFVFHVYRNKLLFIFKNFSARVFTKQLLIYVAHTFKEVFFTRQKRTLKVAKLRALAGALKLLPHYMNKS
ncbi:glycosyltransferase family 2 protein [Paenibacillus massiliensis]|uniref:glycosyltransferase family 2 protein n=1 Tax=Paenibacillus massiliensis TaxID=225917 RepID=UPI00046EE7F9|nr:glycosyltransferase family 2 protein [Paenibacillus massiliensis]